MEPSPSGKIVHHKSIILNAPSWRLDIFQIKKENVVLSWQHPGPACATSRPTTSCAGSRQLGEALVTVGRSTSLPSIINFEWVVIRTWVMANWKAAKKSAVKWLSREVVTSFLSSISGSAAHERNDTTSLPICHRNSKKNQASVLAPILKTDQINNDSNSLPGLQLQEYHPHTQQLHH